MKCSPLHRRRRPAVLWLLLVWMATSSTSWSQQAPAETAQAPASSSGAVSDVEGADPAATPPVDVIDPQEEVDEVEPEETGQATPPPLLETAEASGEDDDVDAAREAGGDEARDAQATAEEDAGDKVFVDDKVLLRRCRTPMLQEEYEQAEACYRRAMSSTTSPKVRLAATELAHLAADKAEAEFQLPPWLWDASRRLVLEGGAEFALASTASGVFGTMLMTAAFNQRFWGSFAWSVTPLVVLGGGVAAFGASAALLLAPGLHHEDVELLRSAALLSLMWGAGTLFTATVNWWQPELLALTSASMAPLIVFFDVPTGAGAAAISGAWMGPTLSLLLATAMPEWRVLPQWHLLAGVVGATTMFGVGAALDLQRPHTWAMDAGAAAGGALAFALALAARAPNPIVGYGTTAGGLVLGAAVGLTTAKALEGAFNQGAFDGWSLMPVLLPDDEHPEQPVVGLGVHATFD